MKKNYKFLNEAHTLGKCDVTLFFFEELYYTDSIYKVYKDKLQNCSCNQFQ